MFLSAVATTWPHFRDDPAPCCKMCCQLNQAKRYLKQKRRRSYKTKVSLDKDLTSSNAACNQSGFTEAQKQALQKLLDAYTVHNQRLPLWSTMKNYLNFHLAI